MCRIFQTSQRCSRRLFLSQREGTYLIVRTLVTIRPRDGSLCLYYSQNSKGMSLVFSIRSTWTRLRKCLGLFSNFSLPGFHERTQIIHPSNPRDIMVCCGCCLDRSERATMRARLLTVFSSHRGLFDERFCA